ncbi:Protein-lysine N-methyltransferase EFM5 [Venustampulla echinocandica]|uniref:Protein-lysine N-methyltransferase EFM5 n=1 Tax=Venustampulla echinocandica TaxID=2656787 RepID=A0A370T9U7_9HELO|nr:Protein-lysine N-methyltransferase EFM5 [Venustampulla echinocandica]RDL30437.1 Protein-lysine N-methyltransferase EFM5 [Venustampulla echinocandica]
MQKSGAAASMNGLRTAVRAGKGTVANPASRRLLSDVTITRTGKPIIRTQGGRSSLGGHTVTVFGATGFLGRYIVNRLARQGCNVIIPYREEMAKRHLKVSGDLGRVTFLEMDLRNTPSIEESVRHSDVVYNLIGRTYTTKNFDFEDVNVEGAARIAEAVAKYDVDRFIHVSSHNADINSPSEYYKTKAQGEAIVRDIFPETTIVRPAPMFGFEDQLLHKLAGGSNILTSNNLQERYWPVHVVDVGMALEKMCQDDSTAEQTYELYGPKNYSTAEIGELVDKEIIKHRRHINIPKRILKPAANLLNKALWWHTLNPDEIEREFIDQKIDETAKTFKDLDITPAELSSLTFHYLQGYRSWAFQDLPPATEREKKEEKQYLHVIDNQYTLSSVSLSALQEFYADRDEREKEYEDLKVEVKSDGLLRMEIFQEDWNESQFWKGSERVVGQGFSWLGRERVVKYGMLNDGDDGDANESNEQYSDETATILAEELLRDATEHTTITVVSAPSVFVQIKNILTKRNVPAHLRPRIHLLEFDKRFEVFPEFVFYDFGNPLKLPPSLKGSADRIIVDPPFLSEDCQTKAALTVRWLAKSWPEPQSSAKKEDLRLVICTGERMETLIKKLYRPPGIQTTDFEPAHSKGLGNEFYCYANFECEDWKWKVDQD